MAVLDSDSFTTNSLIALLKYLKMGVLAGLEP